MRNIITIVLLLLHIATQAQFRKKSTSKTSTTTNTKSTSTPTSSSTSPEVKKELTTETRDYLTGQGYYRKLDRYYFGEINKINQLVKKFDPNKNYNILQFKKINKSPFYQDDIFEMGDDKREAAVEIYKPLIDSIFASEFKSPTLRAEIIIFGYSDEMIPNPKSKSYQLIASTLKKSSLTEMEYYSMLSFLRAKDLSEVITALLMINDHRFANFEFAHIDVITEGRSIEYPDFTREYKLIDDKRKTVKVYYKVYP